MSKNMNEYEKALFDRSLETHSIYTDQYNKFCDYLTYLATGALTLLVSLQKNYVPSNPECLFLLQLSLILLVLSIILGVLVRFGQVQTPLDALRDTLEKMTKQTPEEVYRSLKQYPVFHERTIFSLARKGLIFSFLLAVVFLTWFVLLNL